MWRPPPDGRADDSLRPIPSPRPASTSASNAIGKLVIIAACGDIGVLRCAALDSHNESPFSCPTHRSLVTPRRFRVDFRRFILYSKYHTCLVGKDFCGLMRRKGPPCCQVAHLKSRDRGWSNQFWFLVR